MKSKFLRSDSVVHRKEEKEMKGVRKEGYSWEELWYEEGREGMGRKGKARKGQVDKVLLKSKVITE